MKLVSKGKTTRCANVIYNFTRILLAYSCIYKFLPRILSMSISPHVERITRRRITSRLTFGLFSRSFVPHFAPLSKRVAVVESRSCYFRVGVRANYRLVNGESARRVACAAAE